MNQNPKFLPQNAQFDWCSQQEVILSLNESTLQFIKPLECLRVADVYLTVNPSLLTSDNNEEPGSCSVCSRGRPPLAPPTRSRSPAQRASETTHSLRRSLHAVLFLRKANCYYPTRIVLDLSPLHLADLMNESRRCAPRGLNRRLLSKFDRCNFQHARNFQWQACHALRQFWLAKEVRSGALSPRLMPAYTLSRMDKCPTGQPSISHLLAPIHAIISVCEKIYRSLPIVG